MKTRTQITSSRRPLAPEGCPKAHPSGPAVISGLPPQARTGVACHGKRPGRSLWREAETMGGGLKPYAASRVPNGYRGPCEPYRTALSLGGYGVSATTASRRPAAGHRCPPRPEACGREDRIGCRDRNRTGDLLVMSQASYRCSTLLKRNAKAGHSAASRGYKSGRMSCRETPVSRSKSSTRSAGTFFHE